MKTFRRMMLLTCFIAFAFFANSQVYVNGGLKLTSASGSTTNRVAGNIVTTDDDVDNQFGLVIGGGYFFTDKLAVGADIKYNSYKTIAANNDYDKSSGFGISPYLLYNIAVIEKFSAYILGGVNMEFGNSKSRITNVTIDGNKYNIFGINLLPIVQYNFTDHWAIYSSLGGLTYSGTKITNPGNPDYKRRTWSYGLDFDMKSITFGILYIL